MATSAELAAMRRAVAVSAAGLGCTSPNPPVGCVLLNAEGRIVGEGYHQRKGEAHAEAQALAAAGTLARGATAVVTLEPCNHQGRTPPCRQALIDAGVRRVVIAVTDPTSRGEGGTAALRSAGIDVETGVLEREARVVLGSWLAALGSGRPVIIWPYVLSGRDLKTLPPGTVAASEQLMNADAVLRAHGAVDEAVPGSHGGILRLPVLGPDDDVRRIAASLLRAVSGGWSSAATWPRVFWQPASLTTWLLTCRMGCRHTARLARSLATAAAGIRHKPGYPRERIRPD